ncbi:MAG TPA: AMP-dependent synthetase, partial [Kiloniellaceae bacterium]|nr:AMP-dependent synthetase [Kiloniellaceae bacterium]
MPEAASPGSKPGGFPQADLPATAVSGPTAPWTVQALLPVLAQRGEQPAVVALTGEQQAVLSSAALADLAGRLAAGLRRGGVEPGEAVLLMGENSADWVVVFLALGALGALAVPCDHLATPKQIQRILDDSGCRRAFAAGALLETLRAAAEDRKLTIFTLNAADDAQASPSWRSLLSDTAEELPPLDPAALAVLVYTSGTTGAPKSFTLSHANIGANVEALYREHLAGPGDRLLLPLPLHHVYPIVVGLLVPLASGAAVVFPAGVAGPEIARALREAGVTGIIGVPRLYAALTAGIAAQLAARGWLARRLFRTLLDLSVGLLRRFGWRIGPTLFRPLLARIGPKLRLLVSGGAALGEDLVWQLEGLGWKVRNGYGLAETASTFTGNLPGRERIGSEGRPFQGGELRIAEADAGGVGEIQLRGPNVFSGYRNNPEANREAFTEDGWFRTGDLGKLDDGGYLIFKGRAKELIVLGGGKNVLPEDVESVYGASPFVR